MIDWKQLLLKHSSRPFTKGLLVELLDGWRIKVYAWNVTTYEKIFETRDPDEYARLLLLEHANGVIDDVDVTYAGEVIIVRLHESHIVALLGVLLASTMETQSINETDAVVKAYEYAIRTTEDYLPGYFDGCQYQFVPHEEKRQVTIVTNDVFCLDRLRDVFPFGEEQ